MSDAVIPDGYRMATWAEYATGTATHAICKHGRVVEIEADDHCCRWTPLAKAAAPENTGGKSDEQV
jgi:hypothetical protein